MSKKTPAAKAANQVAAATVARRPNGKAWKKGADGVSAPPETRVKKAVVKTPQRAGKDELVQAHRERRRERGIERARTRRQAEAEVAQRASQDAQKTSTRATAVTKLKAAVK